jgi:hypothetical protein
MSFDRGQTFERASALSDYLFFGSVNSLLKRTCFKFWMKTSFHGTTRWVWRAGGGGVKRNCRKCVVTVKRHYKKKSNFTRKVGEGNKTLLIFQKRNNFRNEIQRVVGEQNANWSLAWVWTAHIILSWPHPPTYPHSNRCWAQTRVTRVTLWIMDNHRNGRGLWLELEQFFPLEETSMVWFQTEQFQRRQSVEQFQLRSTVVTLHPTLRYAHKRLSPSHRTLRARTITTGDFSRHVNVGFDDCNHWVLHCCQYVFFVDTPHLPGRKWNPHI